MNAPRPKFCVGELVLVLGEHFDPKANVISGKAEIVEIKFFSEDSLWVQKANKIPGWYYSTSNNGDTYLHENGIKKLPPEERISFSDTVFVPKTWKQKLPGLNVYRPAAEQQK